MIDDMASRLASPGIPFGFGGIARLIRQAIQRWESAPAAAFRQNRQALIAEVAAWKERLDNTPVIR